MALILIIVAILGSSIQARAACIFHSRADLDRELSEFDDKLVPLKHTLGLIDFFSSKTGCTRAILEKAESLRSTLGNQSKTLEFPPSNENCLKLSSQVDQLWGWLREYTAARSSEKKTGRITPEVCKTGKLRVQFRNPCKPDITPPIQIEALETIQDILQETKAKETQKETVKSLPPKITTTEQPNPTRHVRELISAAHRTLKDFGENKTLKNNSDLGNFYIETETWGNFPRQNVSTLKTDLGQWQERLKTYSKIANSTIGDDHTKTQAVLKQLRKDFLFKYTKSNAELIDFLHGKGGNCEAQTKLIVSVLSALNLANTQGAVLGVQVFNDHVQAVTYDPDTKIATNLLTGEIQKQISAPIYNPLIFSQSYLDARNATIPIDQSQLLIAKPNPSVSQTLQNASRKLSSFLNFDFSNTNSKLKLPTSDFVFTTEPVPEHAILPDLANQPEQDQSNPSTLADKLPSTQAGPNSLLAYDERHRKERDDYEKLLKEAMNSKDVKDWLSLIENPEKLISINDDRLFKINSNVKNDVLGIVKSLEYVRDPNDSRGTVVQLEERIPEFKKFLAAIKKFKTDLDKAPVRFLKIIHESKKPSNHSSRGTYFIKDVLNLLPVANGKAPLSQGNEDHFKVERMSLLRAFNDKTIVAIKGAQKKKPNIVKSDFFPNSQNPETIKTPIVDTAAKIEMDPREILLLIEDLFESGSASDSESVLRIDEDFIKHWISTKTHLDRSYVLKMKSLIDNDLRALVANRKPETLIYSSRDPNLKISKDLALLSYYTLMEYKVLGEYNTSYIVPNLITIDDYLEILRKELKLNP